MTKYIELTRGLFAVIDKDDYKLIKKYKWHAADNEYACTMTIKPDGKRTKLYMHRLIMDAKKGEYVDHVNHNVRDNRRSNLRICTLSENNRNKITEYGTSKYKGVYWSKRDNKWTSQIRKDKKKTYLGLFVCEIEAAKAYNKAAIEMHGEFARLNII